jgi:hypothetical protein
VPTVFRQKPTTCDCSRSTAKSTTQNHRNFAQSGLAELLFVWFHSMVFSEKTNLLTQTLPAAGSIQITHRGNQPENLLKTHNT